MDKITHFVYFIFIFIKGDSVADWKDLNAAFVWSCTFSDLFKLKVSLLNVHVHVIIQ